MNDRYFLDTNILVYAHDSGAALKRDTSRNLIFDCLRNGNGVMSPQVLSEFFVTVTGKIARPVTADQARKVISRLACMTVVDIDATMVLRAIEIKERWELHYRDGLIIAAAERAECGTLYSEDLSAGATYGAVTVCNPFE